MGEIHVSGPSQYSPPSSYDDASSRQQSYQRSRQSSSVSGNMWPTGVVGPSQGIPTFSASNRPGVPASFASGSASASMTMNSTGGSQFVYPEYSDPRIPHTSPMMSSSSQAAQLGYQQTRPQSSMAGHATDEVHQMRNRIRELQLINEHARLRIRTLEAELANPDQGTTYQPPQPTAGFPTSFDTPATSSAFAASWKARTDARTRLLCSLNRAGNALCAWHDSRRERRAYPPRMAPQGYLNCGCTFEEALFEESLSRHGVGSYHPGESVRMDPALRNPLLKVLQRRYGYKDGDFERDPLTGGWVEGDGHIPWEMKAAAGSSGHRKQRTDEHR